MESHRQDRSSPSVLVVMGVSRRGQKYDSLDACAPAALDLRRRRLVPSEIKHRKDASRRAARMTPIAGHGCAPLPAGSTPRGATASTASLPARHSSAPMATSSSATGATCASFFSKATATSSLAASPHAPIISCRQACSTANSSHWRSRRPTNVRSRFDRSHPVKSSRRSFRSSVSNQGACTDFGRNRRGE